MWQLNVPPDTLALQRQSNALGTAKNILLKLGCILFVVFFVEGDEPGFVV